MCAASSKKSGAFFDVKVEVLGGPTWDSLFKQSLPRKCGLRLAPVCFRQGKVRTPHFCRIGIHTYMYTTQRAPSLGF